MAERSEYSKLCKNLKHEKRKQINTAKDEIRFYAQGDRTKVVQIKTEAEISDGNSFLSKMYSYLAVLLATGSFGLTALQSKNEATNGIWSSLLGIALVVVCILWLIELAKTRFEREWSIYFRNAAEDLLENKDYGTIRQSQNNEIKKRRKKKEKIINISEMYKQLQKKEGNPITGAKKIIRDYARGDINKVMLVKAETGSENSNENITLFFTILSSLVAVISLVYAIFLTGKNEKIILDCVSSIICFVFMLCILFYAIWIFRYIHQTELQRKCAKYFKIAAEDLLENKDYGTPLL